MESQYSIDLYDFEKELIKKALFIALQTDDLTDTEKETLTRTMECNFY